MLSGLCPQTHTSDRCWRKDHQSCLHCGNLLLPMCASMLVKAQAGLHSRLGTLKVSEYEMGLVFLQTPFIAGYWCPGNALNSKCCQMGHATRVVTCGASAGPLGGPGWARTLPGGACCWPQPWGQRCTPSELLPQLPAAASPTVHTTANSFQHALPLC